MTRLQFEIRQRDGGAVHSSPFGDGAWSPAVEKSSAAGR